MMLDPAWRIYIYSFVFGVFALFYFIFLATWLTPSKTMEIWINKYNEADAELLILTIIFLMGLYLYWDLFKAIR